MRKLFNITYNFILFRQRVRFIQYGKQTLYVTYTCLTMVSRVVCSTHALVTIVEPIDATASVLTWVGMTRHF